MPLNSTLKEIERRIASNEHPDAIAKDMNIAPGMIYKIFNIPRPDKPAKEALGFEPFAEQPIPITSRPGWRVLRS